jgi:hypothetical protein
MMRRFLSRACATLPTLYLDGPLERRSPRGEAIYHKHAKNDCALLGLLDRQSFARR